MAGKKLHFSVIAPHTSEYPDPITLKKGAKLLVGQKYEGPEAWDNWLFCETEGQRGGWVPAQIIQMIDETSGLALEDYTANELDVLEGQRLTSSRTLNGWAWCTDPETSKSGWVPLANLDPLPK